MPYKYQKRGNRHCIINSETGENKGCSVSKKMAMAHMRALYAHSGPEAKKGSKNK